MTTRVRTLAVGGVLIAIVGGGLLVGFFAMDDDDGASGATPTTPPPTSPSETPTDVKADVEQAYLAAWDVWADALEQLDPSLLQEAFTGPALQVVTDQVEEQRRKNEPVRIRAEHNYRINVIDAQTASIEDRYINHNVRLNPETLEPVEPDQETRVRRSFTLKLVDSTWKIAEIIEYE
ncbi:MAG: hypothetical protein ACRDH6_03105 [Actinomycetota bacterium]